MTFNETLSGTYYSSAIPDVPMTIDGPRVLTMISIDGEEIYREHLYPIDKVVTLADLSELLEPYARRKLSIAVNITCVDVDVNDKQLDRRGMNFTVAYCAAELLKAGEHIEPNTFYKEHFLTLLEEKDTTCERLEYLHYLGTEPATASVIYYDGTVEDFDLTPVMGNDRYTTIDCSAGNFEDPAHGRICSIDISAGERNFHFNVLGSFLDCPAFIFVNSFGCEEMIYFAGTHKVSPDYTRDATYVNGKYKNYKVTEVRKFSADTGYLSRSMAAWVDELMRSDYIKMVTFFNGEPVIGKEITILESKTENSNNESEMARFTCTFRYAQKNNNIVDYGKAGRIFDQTFDNTFN